VKRLISPSALRGAERSLRVTISHSIVACQTMPRGTMYQ
jgi:hypothetical protein